MIHEEQFQKAKSYVLSNKYLSCWICPELGANLYRIQENQTKTEILKSPKTSLELEQSPVMSGIPILIPPNRIRDAKFLFEGRNYKLKRNTEEGHHIHGLVFDKPWRFSTLNDTDKESSLTCTFESYDFTDLFAGFPHNFKVSSTVELKEKTISLSLEVENLSQINMPIGVGYHTWFNLTGGRENWSIKVPYEKIWMLDEELFPTGEFSDGKKISELSNGMSLRDKSFDTIFYRGSSEPTIALKSESGACINYTVNDLFKHWIIHTPVEDDLSIAIEPYSWVTNAVNLKVDNEISGFRYIKPGNSINFSSSIEIKF